MLRTGTVLLEDRRYSVRDDDRWQVKVEHDAFVPRLVVRKFEFGFSLTDPLAGVMGVRHEFGKSAYLTRDQEVHIYPIHRGTEMEVILLKRPTSNRFTFHLAYTPGVSFHLQPAPRHVPNDLVQDSIAIYCNKRHNLYGTGKLGHIWRPEARDAAGRSTWCEVELGHHSLTIIVPPDFLAEAALPITIDPTLGYTTVGATVDGGVYNGYVMSNGWQ